MNEGKVAVEVAITKTYVINNLHTILSTTGIIEEITFRVHHQK